MMNKVDVKRLRAAVGAGVLTAQENVAEAYPPDVVIPEIIAALLSLSWAIARKNAGMSRGAFVEGAAIATREE